MTVSSKAPFKMSYLFLSCLESEAGPPPKRDRRGTQDSSVTNTVIAKKRSPPKNTIYHPRRLLPLKIGLIHLSNPSRMTDTLKDKKNICFSKVTLTMTVIVQKTLG